MSELRNQDQDVQGHGSKRPRSKRPGADLDDVQGHGTKRPSDDDVHGHGRITRDTEADDDVQGHGRITR
jgi:hypothetical protein